MLQKLTFTIEQLSISEKEKLTKRQLEFTQGAIWAVLGGYDTKISRSWQLPYKFLKPQVKFGTLKQVSKNIPIWTKVGNVGVKLTNHSIGTGTAGGSMGMIINKKTKIFPNQKTITTRSAAYRNINQNVEIQITGHIRINFIVCKKETIDEILGKYPNLIPSRIKKPFNKDQALKKWLNLLKSLPPKPNPKITKLPSWFKFDPEKEEEHRKKIKEILTVKDSIQYKKANKENEKYEKSKLEEYKNLLKARFEYDRLIGRFLGRKIMHEFLHTIKFLGGELDMEKHHHKKPEYLMYDSDVYYYKKDIPKVDKRDFIKIKKFGSAITRSKRN